METSSGDTRAPDGQQPAPARWIPTGTFLPLGVAATLFLTAAVAQFVFGPAASPGFSYLAVVCALGGLGALLATNLEASE